MSSIHAGDIASRVIKEIAFHAAMPAEDIKPEHQLVSDLGFDSLDEVECVMALEDEFGVEISDESASKFRTVRQVIDYVAANV
jgi:acyl carrier protein